MEHPANMLAQSLDEALDDGVVSENGFVSVALTGEQLRRMLPMQDDDVSEAERVLARYDELLAGYSGPMPDGLEADLGAVFEELDRLAGDEQQEGEDLENALAHVEDVLAVAAAQWRAGKLETSDVVNLGREAARRAAALAPSLSAVWDLADRASLCLAPNPDLPDLYVFWDEVARYSHERLLFEEVLEAPSAEMRSRVIAAAVERIMETDKPCVPAMRRRVRELEAKVARLLRERVCGGCRRTIPGEEPCCDPATNPANKGDGRTCTEYESLAFHYLRQRDEARAEVERLTNAIKHAFDYAGHRWSEWGSRAESVCEILEDAIGEF
jgi:hypothetical protein